MEVVLDDVGGPLGLEEIFEADARTRAFLADRLADHP